MKKFKEFINESELLVEMARINVKETNGSMPTNKYDVRIWSNDHQPPHFHVTAPDRKNPEYEVIYEIETGNLIKILLSKNSRVNFESLTKLVKTWLNEKSSQVKDKTNREMAMIAWEQNNEQ
jgi:hypothetical protein